MPVIEGGTMSSSNGPMGHQDWPAMEADYWQNTKKARDREDAKLAHEHASRQDQLDQGISELYDKKAHLQNAVDDVDANIEFRKAEKLRLSHEFDRKRVVLKNQRQDEDRSQQSWFTRARENSVHEKEKVMPRVNSGALDHDRTLPNPVPSWTSVNGAIRHGTSSSRVQDRAQEKRFDLFGSVFHNPIEEDVAPLPPIKPIIPPVSAICNPTAHSQAHRRPSTDRNTLVAENHIIRESWDSVLKGHQERHSLPVFPIVNDGQNESPDGSRHSSHGRKSLPSVRDPGSQTNSPTADLAVHVDQEITRECLVLRDNGSTIVQPAMFAGVPLEKIDQNHPFWNPEWEPLEQTVQAALDKWKERLETLRQKPDAVRHTMFLANRQVNRGQSVLDFLKDGCFHPLQFASREMMDKSYKTFVNYDTVFRLVNVHEELKKFDLEVSPLEWLRQRLYEISVEQGEKFSLSKTTHDLYHDVKLKALREKHGFGNIGRPSGYKVGDKGGAKGTVKLKPKKDSLTGSPDEQQQQQAEIRSGARRPFTMVDADDALPHPAVLSRGDYLEPVTPRLPKRQRLDAALVEHGNSLAAQDRAVPLDDFDYDGYSSRDSFSNCRIMHLDFRLHQVKTRAMTTQKHVTQYWTWKPEEEKFEHQILRDVRPMIVWSHYREPEELNCRLEEIREIRYASSCRKIVVARADEAGGNILVNFKRERSMKRFLAFVKRKGVNVLKTSEAYVEETWSAMESETISDRD